MWGIIFTPVFIFHFYFRLVTGCIEHETFANSHLIFDDVYSTCLTSDNTVEPFTKISTLTIDKSCVSRHKWIRFEAIFNGSVDCSKQSVLHSIRSEPPCYLVDKCSGSVLSPLEPHTTRCLIKCTKHPLGSEGKLLVELRTALQQPTWQLCELKIYPENLPLLMEVYSDAPDDVDVEGNWYLRDFITEGMFVINSQIISVDYDRGLNVLAYDPVTENHTFQTFDVYNNLTQEAAFRNHIDSIANGSIVLISVYDSASNCNADCQTGLSKVGGTAQSISLREAMALIGYKGSCRPDWVIEVREPYNMDTLKGDVAIATVTLDTIPVCT